MPSYTHVPLVVSYYRPEMAPPEAVSYSKSPTKPRRFMEFLERTPLKGFLRVEGGFQRVSDDQLMIAHSAGYVRAMMRGGDSTYDPESNGIAWSPELRDSTLLTSASLLAATRGALASPDLIHLSPTSGFHHATPAAGSGFCTFSGQVIAAVDTWRATGKSCAWIDLDGHFGNSIEDTREFCPELDKAIPRGCNINPAGSHGQYVRDLDRALAGLYMPFTRQELNYLCVAVAADNHEHDQLGGQVSTDEWLECVDLVFEHVAKWSRDLGRPVPVVLSLFGGYRDDHPESVLGLHAMGVARALVHLAGATGLATWRADVRRR